MLDKICICLRMSLNVLLKLAADFKRYPSWGRPNPPKGLPKRCLKWEAVKRGLMLADICPQADKRIREISLNITENTATNIRESSHANCGITWLYLDFFLPNCSPYVAV
jgi:hypothetical protein